MGNFYINHTVCGPDVPAIIRELRGEEAYASRAKNGCFVVFDKTSEIEGPPAIERLGTRLSALKGTRVLSVMIADDDVMMYWLFAEGKVADTYNSNPGYEEVVDPPPPPEGGDASKLCSTFGFGDPRKVEHVLQSHGVAGYVFEFERHKALVAALGLPQEAVSTGFNYLAAGEFPQGFGASDLELISR